MKVSVILPTYNEKENIEKMVCSIVDVFKKNKIGGEVVVVDDNSPDGTGKIADRLAKKFKNVQVVHRPKKLGIGLAYQDGVNHAKGGIVITMDCDFSHDPRDLPKLVNAIEGGYDVAIGARYVPGGKIHDWSAYRKMVSRGANTVAKVILLMHLSDITTGYRAYTREALKKIDFGKIRSGGYSFLLVAAFKAEKAGLKIKEIPIEFHDRTMGDTKILPIEQLNFLRTVVRLRLYGN